MRRIAAVLLLLVAAGPTAAQLTITQGENLSVDATPDGRFAIDLLGKIWIVPSGGGKAEQIATGELPARRPQWSPTAESIIYQAETQGLEQIWQYQFADATRSQIGADEFLNLHPSWHPSGERIVFASHRQQSGFDLWEYDLETRLSWRISHLDGDELEPAWSADGRDLVYVHRSEDQWSIMLRRLGEPDRALLSSRSKLSAPQWRPDGSLITFLNHDDNGPSIDMIILSEPLLVRALISNEDFSSAPVSWLGREQIIYAANGLIRQRNFNSWSSLNVPFRADVTVASESASAAPQPRDLALLNVPPGQLVIRTARLFDGIGGGYKNNIDIVIVAGKISALEARRERPGEVIVKLGNVTALPGFIDSFAALPADVSDALGAIVLSLGVTTIVVDHPAAETLDRSWSGKDSPGPRVLTATDMPTTLVYGLADVNSPGLDKLLGLRQAELLAPATPRRRFADSHDLSSNIGSVVVGSKPNGLPPGMATHAEFLALAAAGLNGEQVLRAAGVNAAAPLGVGLHLGRLAPGSRADIVIVDGDPLNNIADLQKVVGVVRNGRFFSAIGLIERAQAESNVE